MAITTAPTTSTLKFHGISDLGIGFGFNLNYNGAPAGSKVFLCVNDTDNRVQVSGTTPFSRRDDVLQTLDNAEMWAQPVQVWLEAEKPAGGTLKSQVLKYTCHVKPYADKLTISSFAKHMPKLTYPGNGKGRLFSEPIRGRRYFIYEGRHETLAANRGLDCTTFPMMLFGVPKIDPPRYGKQLCDKLAHTKCDMEELKRGQLEQLLATNVIPGGIYVFFSGRHVLLYNSDINMIYEFNTPGGYLATPGSQRAMLTSDAWWVRKLDEKYRPCFA